MSDVHIQLLLADPSYDARLTALFNSMGFKVWIKDDIPPCLAPNDLLVVIADAKHQTSSVIDAVRDFMDKYPTSIAVFRLPKHCEAPVWGDRFGLRAGYITTDCGEGELVSYLVEFIRVTKSRINIDG